MEQFIKDNIEKFNSKPNSFKNTSPNNTQIKDFLRKKFIALCDNIEFRDRIVSKFANLNYQRSKIMEIANEECLYKNDLEHFLEAFYFVEISRNIEIKKIKELTLNYIESTFNNNNKFNFIKSKLSKVLEKSLFIASIDGFSTNLLNIDDGVMTANAGDSAQFLFIARAILAGFNASNVDVRSSRYDAIVDYQNILLRVQVKGISSSGIISFKDRDRGGQGIDHTHERNKGKRITQKDCDIYVAVDKQVGICYIIPMSFADTLTEEECTRVKLTNIEKYKENWQIIKEVAIYKNSK